MLPSRCRPCRQALPAAFLLLACALLPPQRAAADQGGVSFWLPGSFGSLAATPLQPGWSFGTFYLHANASGAGDIASSRAIRFPNRTANLNVTINASIQARTDAVAGGPTYVFATPVFGGQFAMSVLALYGRGQATIDANITGSLGPIGFATERSVSDSLAAFGD